MTFISCTLLFVHDLHIWYAGCLLLSLFWYAVMMAVGLHVLGTGIQTWRCVQITVGNFLFDLLLPLYIICQYIIILLDYDLHTCKRPRAFHLTKMVILSYLLKKRRMKLYVNHGFLKLWQVDLPCQVSKPVMNFMQSYDIAFYFWKKKVLESRCWCYDG